MIFAIYNFELECDFTLDITAKKINNALGIELAFSGGSDEVPYYEYLQTLDSIEVQYQLWGIPETDCWEDGEIYDTFSFEIMFMDENGNSPLYQCFIDNIKNRIAALRIREDGWIPGSGE